MEPQTGARARLSGLPRLEAEAGLSEKEERAHAAEELADAGRNCAGKRDRAECGGHGGVRGEAPVYGCSQPVRVRARGGAAQATCAAAPSGSPKAFSSSTFEMSP